MRERDSRDQEYPTYQSRFSESMTGNLSLKRFCAHMPALGMDLWDLMDKAYWFPRRQWGYTLSNAWLMTTWLINPKVLWFSCYSSSINMQCLFWYVNSRPYGEHIKVCMHQGIKNKNIKYLCTVLAILAGMGDMLYCYCNSVKEIF